MDKSRLFKIRKKKSKKLKSNVRHNLKLNNEESKDLMKLPIEILTSIEQWLKAIWMKLLEFRIIWPVFNLDGVQKMMPESLNLLLIRDQKKLINKLLNLMKESKSLMRLRQPN